MGLAAAVPSTLFIRQDDSCYVDGGYCSEYCENSTGQLTGPPQNVSDHITCDTSGCPAAILQTYTSMQSFTLNVGIDAEGGDETIKGGASAGDSWSWFSSSATSNAYTFTLQDGDAGNIVSRPYYHQSCGDLKFYQVTFTTSDATPLCTTVTVIVEDMNACGQTPIIKRNNFTDRNFTFCYSAGPKAGQGC